MWLRFFEAYTPESNKKAGPKPCLILSDESIPGELLLSRARFRLNSSVQKSNEETIFTTCQKRQPFTNARRDTIYHKEIRFYDSNNKLVKGYNLFQNGFYKSYFQGRSFVPDSFFYQYDSCGNCTEIIWYLQGNKSIKTQKLYYHTPAMQILVDGPGYPSEVWKFNTLGQLTQLITEEHKIEINYHQKEMVHFYIYEDLKSSYYSHSPSSSLYIIRYTYHYDSNNRLIKVKEQKYDKVKRTTVEKWVTINWYPNGLIRNDFEGNVFTYTYYNN